MAPDCTCTTMVRSFGTSWVGFLGGCGTSASSPFGVTGTMTMKMISSTSSTSISGVTLISETDPPDDPALIPITILLFLSGGLSDEQPRNLIPSSGSTAGYRSAD